MSRIAGIALGALAAVAAVAAYESFFIVDEREQAIVLQFGEPRRVVREPGLQFKIPFIQNVTVFDRRILLFDNPVEEIISSDQKRLIVDAFARYRIVDPLLFFQTIRFELALRTRLGSIINDSLRQVLGEVPLQEVISEKRAALMAAVADGVRREARPFGIHIEDVRVRRADLPNENSEAIYRRMQTERQQEAAQIRAEGEEEARRVRAAADRDKTVILAEAERDAEVLRGRGEAEKNRIFASAFGQDPEFFAFYRSMQAYQKALTADDTTMVLSPNSQFFQFFGTDAVAPPE
jgi:membrane protease subunit HflC